MTAIRDSQELPASSPHTGLSLAPRALRLPPDKALCQYRRRRCLPPMSFVTRREKPAHLSSPPSRPAHERLPCWQQYQHLTKVAMCRNIKTLFNFEPPATEVEIRDASLQFVRKLTGFNVPSRSNEAAFERAVKEVADSARVLIRSLVTVAEPRTREVEAAKARAKSALRFGVRQ